MPVQSTPVRRDMSYRKPVPVYVPSPPSPSSPDLPQVTVTVSESSLPPLPPNLKLSIVHHSKDMTLGNSKSEVPEILLSIPKDGSDTSSVNQPTDKVESNSHASVYSQSTTGRKAKRGLPQTYRPPTPPLISNNTPKTPEDSREFLTVPSPFTQGIRDSYFPPVAGFRAQPSMQGSPQTLSPQPSFQTDKTLVSAHSAPELRYNTWQTTRSNQALDQWHDLPILPMHIIKPRRGSGSTGSRLSKSVANSSARKRRKWSVMRAFQACMYGESV